MRDYVEIVKGRIVDQQQGAPVMGATVEVYDKDMLIDDYLGTATTDAEGRFEVEFSWADYKDSFFEGRPDIFLIVLNPISGKTTRSKVFYDLRGELAKDESEEVMDLGEVPVD